jgi:hypothetical protein
MELGSPQRRARQPSVVHESLTVPNKHGRRYQSAAEATAGGPIARKERVWSAGCPFAEATGGAGVDLIRVYPV